MIKGGKWLLEETHIPKVMRSNPGTVYWTDICCEICNVFEKTKINEKRGRGWPI